jgi:hypothetical protein
MFHSHMSFALKVPLSVFSITSFILNISYITHGHGISAVIAPLASIEAQFSFQAILLIRSHWVRERSSKCLMLIFK